MLPHLCLCARPSVLVKKVLSVSHNTLMSMMERICILSSLIRAIMIKYNNHIGTKLFRYFSHSLLLPSFQYLYKYVLFQPPKMFMLVYLFSANINRVKC